MFKPKYVKQGDLLLKGVEKFLKYKDDLISESKMDEIAGVRQEFAAALKSREEAKAGDLAKQLTKLCEGAVPEYKNSWIGENVEVIFVAIVIALGIRAYFLQPFKIPTGSMYPTLNGIIATPMTDDEEGPSFLKKAIQYVWYGRNYVELKAPRDGRIASQPVEKTHGRFFTFTYLDMDGGEDKLKAYAPLRQFVEDLWRKRQSFVGVKVVKDEVLARGYVDTGDQVLVNKLAYHFRKPERGEVFVFNTAGIAGITPADIRQGSQHYIKRLAAVPGDTLRIDPPILYIDGERAPDEGFQKVMDKVQVTEKKGYHGYTLPTGDPSVGRDRFEELKSGITMGDEEYFAMGDNSNNSSDSRKWGTVPEKNIVGPALLVYWPFNDHWGFID